MLDLGDCGSECFLNNLTIWIRAYEYLYSLRGEFADYMHVVYFTGP